MTSATTETATIGSGRVHPDLPWTDAHPQLPRGEWVLEQTGPDSAVLRRSRWAAAHHVWAVWSECRALGWIVDPAVEISLDGDQVLQVMTKV